MDGPRAISGTYADLKFVKTRSVAQIVVEISIEKADDFLAMFGAPQPGSEVPVALARLVATPKVEPPAQKERTPFNQLPLSQQCAIRCGDAQFRDYMEQTFNHSDGPQYIPLRTAEDAASLFRMTFGIASRSVLDTDARLGTAWKAMEDDYQKWLTTQRYADAIR